MRMCMCVVCVCVPYDGGNFRRVADPPCRVAREPTKCRSPPMCATGGSESDRKRQCNTRLVAATREKRTPDPTLSLLGRCQSDRERASTTTQCNSSTAAAGHHRGIEIGTSRWGPRNRRGQTVAKTDAVSHSGAYPHRMSHCANASPRMDTAHQSVNPLF